MRPAVTTAGVTGGWHTPRQRTQVTPNPQAYPVVCAHANWQKPAPAPSSLRSLRAPDIPCNTSITPSYPA